LHRFSAKSEVLDRKSVNSTTFSTSNVVFTTQRPAENLPATLLAAVWHAPCMAENSSDWNDDAPVRTPGGRFAPGSSGNPRGARAAVAPTLPNTLDALASPRNDGWASSLTGIGSAARDKRMSHSFCPTYLTYQQLIDMWLGSDLAKRAVEDPPGEAFRPGYEIVIADEGKHGDLKEKIEGRLRDLRVDQALERAWQVERALGGAAVLLGVDDGQSLASELDPEKVNGITYLQVLEPLQLQPATFYTDDKSAKYGEPLLYQVMPTPVVTENSGNRPGGSTTGELSNRSVSGKDLYIHESRLIVLGGIRVSMYQRPYASAGGWWGDSILAALHDIIRDFEVAAQSAGLMVVDFSQAVMKMKGLIQTVARGGNELEARMRALDMGRSVARAVLIDADEEFERKSTNVSGLAELLNWLASRVASALDMPLTRLMGQSPKGLGNEGETDAQFYYDRIAKAQRQKVAPWLRRVVKLVIASLGETEPKSWDIRFNTLWQSTDQEVAEARLTMARADSLYLKMGALYADEVRQSRFGGRYSFETQIDVTKKAPGPIMPPGHTPIAGHAGAPGTPGGKPIVPAGMGAHGVTSYTRKNPTRATESASAGGAAAPGAGAGAKKDGAEPRPSRIDAVAAALAALGDDEFDAIMERVLEPADREG
jgi:phage-related protein (TIGR01555 family)